MKPIIKYPIPLDMDFRAWILSMPIVTLDYETYYDSEYSLTKMTTLEYVQDDRFKAQGVSIRVDRVVDGTLVRGMPTYYPDVEEAMQRLREFEEAEGKWVLVAQNTKFDGYIMHYRYNIHPTVYTDTKSMSKGLWPLESSSLKDLAVRLWPDRPDMRKGEDLVKSFGIRDWSNELHNAIEGYCNQDAFLTAEAFWEMFNRYPAGELEIIHITMRMFCFPTLQANHAMLEEAEQDELDERERVLEVALEFVRQLARDKGFEYWNPDEKEAKKRKPMDKMVFSSRNRFIKVLRELCDLELPTKTETRKDGSTYETEAVAKNDPEYIDLIADNPDIGILFETREIFASNQALSRARRMRHISKEERGFEISIPLAYYNAHTGRYGGDEKLNMQNLGRGSKHRLALEAPEGFMVHVADSSNVEARINAGFSGQEDLLEAFRRKEDVYSQFASEIYPFKVDKKNYPGERGVGKVCVGPDTRVLTHNGVKKITDITIFDKLWDGVEWVNHMGVVCNGVKETITAFELEATRDHEILTTDNSWVEWQQVLTNPSLMKKVLDKGHLHWSDGGSNSTKMTNLSDGILWFGVIVDGKEWSTEQISQQNVQHAVRIAQNWLLQENDILNTSMQCQMSPTELDCSTDYRLLSQDATIQETECTSTTDCEGLQWPKNGGMTEQNSSNMCKRSKDGIVQNSKWTEQTLTEVMNLKIFGSSRKNKTLQTNEKSPTLKNGLESLKRQSKVYDVVMAGPRNRFTVITSLGPMIIHNCVLGLGYGMGAPTLRRTFASGPMGMPPMKFDLPFCQHIVSTYRGLNFAITDTWKTAGRMIEAMIFLQDGAEVEWGPLVVMRERIKLPNGMYLNYPKLHYHEKLKSFAYWDNVKKYWKRIYGGALLENVIQALARIAVMDQCTKIDRYLQQFGGWIVMQVHDENIGIAPHESTEKSDAIFEGISAIMRQSPSWMRRLPLDSEGGYAKNYSK